MAENRKGRGQGLFYWTRGQLLGLALGFAVTSVIVFFLGMVVGQGMEERKLLKKEEPLVRVPIQPLPEGATAAGTPGKEEMTFYDTLGKSSGASQVTRVEPAQEIKPGEKGVKSAAKEAKAPAVAEKVPPAEKIAKVRPGEKAGEKTAAEKAAVPVEARKELPGQKAQGRTTAKAGAGGKVWAVQLNAYPLERDAKRLAKKLKDKGYDAYVTSTTIKGRNWYRVRVGHLESQDEVRTLQEKLKTKENFTKSITTSR